MMTDWINIVKMSVLPNVVYKFKAIPIKIPKMFFARGVDLRGHQIAKAILRRNKTKEFTLLISKLIAKHYLSKIVWY